MGVVMVVLTAVQKVAHMVGRKVQQVVQKVQLAHTTQTPTEVQLVLKVVLMVLVTVGLTGQVR